MSDSNDDLLNYELGEDLDDQALLAGDEDELFLSDEEIDQNVSLEQKALLKDEAEKWVSSKLKDAEPQESTTNVEVECENVVTSGPTEILKGDNEGATKKTIEIEQQENVSSDEIHIVTQQLENTNNDLSGCDPHIKMDEIVSSNSAVEEQMTYLVEQENQLPPYHVENVPSELRENSEQISQLTQENENICKEMLSDQGEENEERHERANIKQAVERDSLCDPSRERYQGPRFTLSKRGRNAVKIRGPFPGVRPVIRYPHIAYPQYQPLPNENINPHMSQPYFSFRQSDQMNSRQPTHFPPNNQVQIRMEYRSPMGPNFRPQNPNDFNLVRCPRQDFPNSMNGNMFNTFHASTMMRPVYRPDTGVQIPSQRFDSHLCPPIPEQMPTASGQNNLGYVNSVLPTQISAPVNQQQPANVSQTQFPPQYVPQPVLPRKVLINPNFKGGVEAATSQLMKDTQFIQAISSHVSHLQSDEELLRQQEEFININRIHIERRRYERSPERNRSRERSYSPPRRERRADSRERRGGSRGRSRRGNSREFEMRNLPKRRRSGSFERRREKDKPDEEEDAETRAYRMEIEKQKAMREKILRDKEMRRRRAAEGKLKDDDKTTTEEPPQKLKPIIVTESKIISLKKKPTTTSQNISDKQTASHHQNQMQQQQTIQRTIPTAKILPEAKRKITELAGKDPTSASTAALAVIKPVVKKQFPPQPEFNNDIMDDEMLEEELLLADTPSPPTSPNPHTMDNTFNIKGLGNGGGNVFSTDNRRIVLKSSKDTSKDTIDIKKGIFDRLEEKVIINKAIKRKIKRIVIKKSE